jgi:hypothetical protein
MGKYGDASIRATSLFTAKRAGSPAEAWRMAVHAPLQAVVDRAFTPFAAPNIALRRARRQFSRETRRAGCWIASR